MTVIAVTATDPGDTNEPIRWDVPTDNALNASPIPRGLRVYRGTAAVLALGANDETNVDITLTFPTAFCYLPKAVSISFVSDDLTTEFENIGSFEYDPAGGSALGSRSMYELLCDGPSMRAAVRSEQTFRPMGTWRQWIRGNNLDRVRMFLADISNDTSTAGDVAWWCEFWEYDIEQCFQWPVNTPTQVYSTG